MHNADKNVLNETESNRKTTLIRKLKNPNVLLLIVGVLLFVIISIIVPNFLTVRNITNIISQSSTNGLMAIGLTFVIITKGIDLSLPTNMAFSAIIGSMVMAMTQSGILGFLVICGVAVAIGVINGISVSKFRMVPMIVTLAVSTIIAGSSNWITGARSVGGLPQAYRNIFAGDILGIPTQAIIFIVIAVIMHLFLSKTKFGQDVYQTGVNEKAAKVNGVNIGRIKFLVYVISGLMAGITGVLVSARLGSAGPSIGTQDQFLIIVCATVLGGASVTGGKGTILGTVIASIFMTVITNAMNLYGVDHFITFVIMGAIIVVFTYFDLVRNKIGESRVR